MAVSPSNMTPQRRSDLVKRIAGRQGFAACGICSADPIERKDYVLNWLAGGLHGRMEYLNRHVDVRLDPRQLLPGARSVIVIGWLYRVRQEVGERAGESESPTGRIARYAWGRDYHRVIRKRLREVMDELRQTLGVPFEGRICVDTAPLLERELAMRAGVGWIGHNCLVLNRELGSYFCLGAVVTTLELAPDAPAVDRCGTCNRCLKACPTGALVGPKRMDPRRCISYRTIELPADVAEEPFDLAGQLFGCDICQEVCPYNGPHAAISIDPDTEPGWPAGQLDLARVLSWGWEDWDGATRGRSLRRASLAMWQRNARRLLPSR